MPYSAGYELDLLVAIRHCPPVTGFTADPDYPELTAQLSAHDFWTTWYEIYILGRIPPGHRVICGVTLPAYSTTLALAQQAADSLNVAWGSSDTAVDICNRIVTPEN